MLRLCGHAAAPRVGSSPGAVLGCRPRCRGAPEVVAGRRQGQEEVHPSTGGGSWTLQHRSVACRSSPGSIPTFSTLSAEAGAALLDVGALLLKGQASTAKEAEEASIAAWRQAGFQYGLGDYNRGGTVVRPELAKNVYDVAAGAPADRAVAAHCEKAYQALVPHFVAFACFRPADRGGELQLMDVAKVTASLPAAMVERLRLLGVTYLRRMGDEELTPDWSYATGTWQQRFGTRDFVEAQRRARGDHALAGPRGASLERGGDGTAVMTWHAAALAKDSPAAERGGGAGGEELVVTSILDNHRSMNYGEGESPLHSTWGDGTEFSEGELAALKEAMAASEWMAQRLEPGDVIIANNFRFAHGRLPYEGPRKHVGLMSEQVPRGLAVPGQPAGSMSL